MKLFVDTANVDEIRQANDMGVKYRKRRCILCCLLSVLGQTTYLGKERI